MTHSVGTVLVSNVKIRLLRAGSGPKVVFLHGELGKVFPGRKADPAGGKDRHRGAHLHRAIYQATGCADRQQLDFVPKA